MSELPQTGFELRSLVTEEGEFSLFIKECEIPEPGENEVVVRIEAAPINPSDQSTLIMPADLSTGETSGSAYETVYRAKLKPEMRNLVKPRIGKALRMGNEGAGTVIKAGSSAAAQALLGKTVAVMDGALYCQYRKVNVLQCIVLNKGTSAKEGASCFVNPLTALGMIETMRIDGCKALIHTAAASNLGQMLNRACIKDGIDLINIVRKQEQVDLLKAQGAKFICNSSDVNFKKDLAAAIEATGAYIAFDATGGGNLVNQIFSAMEAAALKDVTTRGAYGSNVFKRVYIYGGLDSSPTVINRNFGFSWSLSGFLLTPVLEKLGIEKSMKMRQRVADELTTTFASHYTKEISLVEVLQKENILAFSKQATGEKYLITPFKNM